MRSPASHRDGRRNRATPIRLAVAAITLFVPVACGLTRGERPTLVPTTTTVPPTEATVLDPGAEPRRQLRYSFTTGQETTTVVSMGLTVDQSSDIGTELVASPTIDQTIRFTVVATDPNGADLAFEIVDAAVERAGTTLSDEEWLLLTAQARRLVGLRGTARMSDRGEVLAFDHSPPPGIDADLGASLASATDAPGTLTLPLPTTAVGVGARWETITGIDVGGTGWEQTTTYSITSITGTEVAYTGTIEQVPRRPRGASGSVEGGYRGTVEGTIDLSRFVPTSSTVLDGTVTGSSTGPDGTGSEVTQERELTLSVVTVD